jgi:hypothetical protein
VEPISGQATNAAAWGRPAPAADLSAVLRQGRVLAGEVLQTLSGGTVLIGVGRHRVPAQTDAQLQPGQRYLFEVAREGPPVQLRVLSSGAEAGDAALLRALRSALGADRPLGGVLESLLAALQREAEGPSAKKGVLLRMLDAITSRAFAPGADGAELAAKLRSGGLAYEARWTALAQLAMGGAEANELASLLRGAFYGELGGDAELERAFGGSLARLFHSQEGGLDAVLARWLAAGRAGDLPGTLGALLERAAAAADVPSHARQALLARLRALAVDGWPAGVRRALLEALLGVAPRSGGAGPREVALAAADLALDLKAELLRGLQELGPGEARAAVERALAQLEAEQLLNLARGAAAEPPHWSLPVLEGARWTTAHLAVHRDREHSAPEPDDGATRLALSVEFSRTGPVRIDLLERAGTLALRVLVGSESVAGLLRARLPELEQHLAFGGRAVRASVAIAPEEDLRGDDGVQGVGYLRDHHVMDCLG